MTAMYRTTTPAGHPTWLITDYERVRGDSRFSG
jgi:hypothetical protein